MKQIISVLLLLLSCVSLQSQEIGLRPASTSGGGGGSGTVSGTVGAAACFDGITSIGDCDAGTGIVIAAGTIQSDDAIIPQYSTGSGAPSASNTLGKDFYMDTVSTIPYVGAGSTTWQQLITATLAQTLTNKTFTDPNLGAAPSAMTIEVANASSTGTTVNKLAKLTGAPSTAVIAGTSDTGGIVGVVVSGAGTTGNAKIARLGTVTCAFDAATTAGNYVKISASVAGDCADAGATRPTSGQIIGRVLETIGSAGNAKVVIAGPELQGGGGGATTAIQELRIQPGSRDSAVRSGGFTVPASNGCALALGGATSATVSANYADGATDLTCGIVWSLPNNIDLTYNPVLVVTSSVGAGASSSQVFRLRADMRCSGPTENVTTAPTAGTVADTTISTTTTSIIQPLTTLTLPMSGCAADEFAQIDLVRVLSASEDTLAATLVVWSVKIRYRITL